MAASGLLHLWKAWGIQLLVLTSFALQVFLLVLGGIRRHSSSTLLKISLWFAYLLADSTAIYTLGHLSIVSDSGEHQLVAFWAPFLLLHLGGPDNITAYALEDNRLWLRHLQTLGVQVLGAAYVLYKYMAGSGTLLRLASVSMFIAGLVKYGERTWALRCGNKMGSFRSRSGDNEVDPFRLLRHDMGDEEILIRAHEQFGMCKGVFNDAYVSSGNSRNRPVDPAYFYSPRLGPFYDEDIFKLLEMELSLMYDMLYTKAAVIHTWYGFCIHAISLVGTATAFCFFQLSVSSSSSSNGYSRVDVAISYFLLVGALALEATSACRAVLSSWTCFFILRKVEGCSSGRRGLAVAACLEWLHHYVLLSLRKLFKPASRRLWRGTIGQYNLFHLSTRDRTDLGSRMAKKLGQEERWNRLHFSGTFPGSGGGGDSSLSLTTRQLKELLFRTIRREGFATRTAPLSPPLHTRGRFILERKQAFVSFAQWSVLNIEFQDSILMWHIATDLFIWEYAKASASHDDRSELEEATRVLSNYMMFLLVAKPGMLPGRARDNLYLKSCKTLEGVWQRLHVLGDEDKPAVNNKCSALKELFQREGPDCSTITQAQREKLAETLLHSTKVANNQWAEQTGPGTLEGSRDEMHTCAAWLTKQLLDLGPTPGTLELIFMVWVEMMLYAAEQCPRESHARELCNGGEFITIVWLLVHHWIFVYRHKIAC